MKKLIKIFLLLGAAFVAANGINSNILNAGSVTGSAILQDSDTLNLNALLKVNPFRLDIIDPSTGVQFYRDGIVFLSNSRSDVKMLESHTSFGTTEAYYATYKDTTIGNRNIFSASASWMVPCEAMTFNSDYSAMYYTKIPSRKESEKIFQATYQVSRAGKSDWISDSKPLSFCSDKSVYTHPSLSADGEKMIFVSDRRESIGGLDLFISYKEGNDWSAPINLGNLINTQGNETHPFLDQENNLFFSSDGIKGLGGYDIYFCRYNGRGWDKPVNMTQKINTVNDDIAFTLSRLDGKSAFYTSRLKTGTRQPRLYKINLTGQYALHKLTGLSDLFKYIAQGAISAFEAETPVAIARAETVNPETGPEKKPVQETLQPQIQTEKTKEPVKPAVEKTTAPADEIIFRVQFLSVSNPQGRNNISIGGSTYPVYEYLFNGAYRICAGEYSTPEPATNLQNIMKRNGYPDAFVVAFRNNERLTGSLQSIIKLQEQIGQKPMAETVKQTVPVQTKPEQVAIPVADDVSPSGDAIIFRVQFLSSSQPRGSYEITAGGRTYETFEYLYNGAYRSCAGEFNDLASAAGLQRILKQGEYPDAFVVAFKNNVRVTDPALFR